MIHQWPVEDENNRQHHHDQNGTVGNRYTVFAIFHAVEDVSRRYAGIRRDEEHNGADGGNGAHKAVNQRREDRRAQQRQQDVRNGTQGTGAQAE